MAESLDDLVSPEQFVEPPRKRSSPLTKLAFIAVLLIAGTVIAVPLGNMAVRGIANAFGYGLDATHCEIYEANQCSSVSLSEIDGYARTDLPADSSVIESSWSQFLLKAQLYALIRLPDGQWTPPDEYYEPCGTSPSCPDEVPDVFERHDVTLSGHYVPNRSSNLAGGRELYVGIDAAGDGWVFIQGYD